jgi:uncharacterized protein GlcG (DUF336 family)
MAKTSVFSLSVDLSLEQARMIVRGTLQEGRRRELMPLAVIVLDAGGHLIAMEREDGSGVLRFGVAQGKAYGALGVGIASRIVGERNEGRDAFLGSVAAASGGRFVPVAGGVLILNVDGKVIGAAGVSGDTSDADEACAVHGIEAAGLRPAIDTPDD